MIDHTLHDLLLRCLNTTQIDVQNSILPHLKLVEWEQFITLAKKQRVAPLLYHRIKQHGLTHMVPQQVMSTLEVAYRTNAIRNLKLYQEIEPLIQILRTKQIPTVLLKGAHLAQAVYTDRALRFMIDCDILVPETALAAVVEIVMSLGYQPLTPLHQGRQYTCPEQTRIASLRAEMGQNFSGGPYKVRHHLPRFAHSDKTFGLEIHWTITRPNQAFSIDMDDMWRRTQPFTFAGVESQVFCPEDLLLYNCLHAAYHHFFLQGVRPLCDIVEITQRYGDRIDWDMVCQRSIEWGWTKGVYLTLQLSDTFLNAAIPQEVLQKLQPGDFDAQLIESAKAQFFNSRNQLDILSSSHFMQLLGKRSIGNKVKLLINRFALSRQELAYMYGLPLDSPNFLRYYAVRFKDLLLRFIPKMWRYLSSETELRHAVQHRNRFVDWLEQA